MLCVQLHKPTLYHCERLIITGDTDNASLGTADIHHKIQNAENGFLFAKVLPKQHVNGQRFSEIALILVAFTDSTLIKSRLDGIDIAILSIVMISIDSS